MEWPLKRPVENALLERRGEVASNSNPPQPLQLRLDVHELVRGVLPIGDAQGFQEPFMEAGRGRCDVLQIAKHPARLEHLHSAGSARADALGKITWMVICKGGLVADITVGEHRQLRGHWMDRLPAIDADIELMAKQANQVKTADASPERRRNRSG